MNQELSSFAACLRERIAPEDRVPRGPDSKNENGDSYNSSLRNFDLLAVELFALQFQHNPAYRKICEGRGVTPGRVEHWTQIPFVPSGAFKELELSGIPPAERVAVFHSSGTTEQKPSRHFHGADSLAVYEASLWSWFAQNVLGDAGAKVNGAQLVCLTPSPERAPNSSLVHMFETVRRKLGAGKTVFVGELAADGSWVVDFERAMAALEDGYINEGSPPSPRPSPPGRGGNAPSVLANRGSVGLRGRCADVPGKSYSEVRRPRLILGTAFSFVHLLDYLVENNLRLELPAGSRVMETGGYKNRSRVLPKTELHALITRWLGVPQENIICEYGMSELSSQAYDATKGANLKLAGASAFAKAFGAIRKVPGAPMGRHFRFPPWARVQIISPETGREVADGETGLIRIFDLANVFSVAAIQTEDLGVRCGDGFELAGRAQLAEPRGCSLMTA